MSTRLLLEFCAVAFGGALGASTRFGIFVLIKWLWRPQWPWATFVANVIGCLLMGLLLSTWHPERGHMFRMFFGVGFLGALTTFSTFSAETIQQLEQGHWWVAIVNVVASVTGCLMAVSLGLWLGRRFLI